MEGASLRGCNFEDPAGTRANLEGKIFPSIFNGPHCRRIYIRGRETRLDGNRFDEIFVLA